MEGQLSWDGIVHPIKEVTWNNVLETATRMQGLEVNEDFFVTYKDDEGDVINVKNEDDLAEAIVWASETGIPCLCLEVPFAADDSDSDESWTEVLDSSSQKGRENNDAHAVNDEHRLLVDETEATSVEETNSVIETGQVHETAEQEDREHVRDSEVHDHVEESSAGENVEDEVRDQAEEFANGENIEDETHDQADTPFNDHVSESSPRQEDKLSAPEETEDVPTAGTPVTLEATPIPAVLSQMEEEFKSTVRCPDLTSQKLVGDMLHLNDPRAQGSKLSDRDLLLEILSDTSAVVALARLVQTEDFLTIISSAAQAEKATPNLAQRVASHQLIKAMYKNPQVIEDLKNVPHADEVVLRLLRLLPNKPLASEPETDGSAFSEPPKAQRTVTHSSVTCDGCLVDTNLKDLSLKSGFRNEAGEIVGVRYKSAIAPDYDLCETCEASGRFASNAPFLKITNPAHGPELILCVMPGATSGMMSNLDVLDWRNPLAKEFFDFVQGRQQRAFPQNRQPSVAAPTIEPTKAAESVRQPQDQIEDQPEQKPKSQAPVPAAAPVNGFKCKHPLKRFEVGNDTFSCDICNKHMPIGSVLNGCRACNFDACEPCFSKNTVTQVAPAPTEAPVVAVAEPPPPPTPSPPQAKFVSDLTLTDGCVVRPGERLDKVWRVRNSGSETWPKGTRIMHVGGDDFGAPAEGVEVPLAKAGEVVLVTVSLVMPTQPGRYTSYWRMVTPQSSKFGHRFWVTVNVVTPPPQPPVQQPVRPAPLAIGRPVAPLVPQLSFTVTPASAPPLNTIQARSFNDGRLVGSPDIPSPSPFIVPPSTRPTPPPPPQAVSQQEVDIDVPDEYVEAVTRIIDVGITADIARIVRVLRESNGNTGDAINRLLEGA